MPCVRMIVKSDEDDERQEPKIASFKSTKSNIVVYMVVAAEYVGFTIMNPQNPEDGGDDENCISLESSIKVSQCPTVISAMNTRTNRLVFQTVHVRITRFVDVQATTILPENAKNFTT